MIVANKGKPYTGDTGATKTTTPNKTQKCKVGIKFLSEESQESWTSLEKRGREDSLPQFWTVKIRSSDKPRIKRRSSLRVTHLSVENNNNPHVKPCESSSMKLISVASYR